VTVSGHPVAYGYDEYLEHEEACNTRNEYLNGQIYAVAGASPEHNRLVAAITGFLVSELAGSPCRAYSSDQRIRVLETGLATYPDVTVICGRIEIDADDRRRHTAKNPTVLVEVLSPSTEEYDRGEKFEHYKRIPALRQYVLASKDEPKLEVWTREGASWSSKTFRDGDVAELASVGARLDVGRLYAAASETS
jgi:Uma2 family endonuclease